MALTKAQILAFELLAQAVLTIGFKIMDLIGKTDAEKRSAFNRALAGAKSRDPKDLTQFGGE